MSNNPAFLYFCSKYKNWEHMTTSIDIARRIAEVNHPLSRESVHALAEILVCRKYRKGEIVLQAGEVCKSMLFIEKECSDNFIISMIKI